MKNIDGEFSKVVSAFPDEFPHENSGKALGIGDAGIVAAHDDIVTKFYFRPENSDAEKKTYYRVSQRGISAAIFSRPRP